MEKVFVWVGNAGTREQAQPRFRTKISEACREIPDLRAVINDPCWGMEILFAGNGETRPEPVMIRITLPCGVELPQEQGDQFAKALAESLGRFYKDHGYDPRQVTVSLFNSPRFLTFKKPEELLAQLRPNIDGVTLRVGAKQATFLPGDGKGCSDPSEFMSTLAKTAGLDPKAWQEPNAKVCIYSLGATFTAKVVH
jgi:hypothetical protein